MIKHLQKNESSIGRALKNIITTFQNLFNLSTNYRMEKQEDDEGK